ncbi:MAG: hypothetical protein K2J13_01785, partial [Clostridia bacterium]|nr:hypothetical protein [Clostridia bacterium]
MDIRKRKLKGYIALSVLIILCLVMTLCTGFLAFNLQNREKTAYAASSDSIHIGNLLVDNYASSNKKINTEILDDLYSAVTGNKNATIDDVSNLISNSTKYNCNIVTGKTLVSNAGAPITLTFGGLEWVVTSLTETKDGAPVATLMLHSQNGLTTTKSKFSQHTSATGNYPAAVYGLSSVRVSVLNAGGVYSKTISSLSDHVEQKADNDWAIFTMSNEQLTGTSKENQSLTSFLATPSEIYYQEIESFALTGSFKADLGSDCYGTSAYNKWTYGDNYFDKTKFPYTYQYANLWKDDYVWLPSVTEIGRSKDTAATGYWDINPKQVYQGSVEYWSRSGHQAYIIESMVANSTTTLPYTVNQSTTQSKSVFPCIHLNLEKIESYSKIRTSYTKTYDGEEFNLESMFPGIRTTCSTNCIDGGVHNINVD